MIQKKVRNLLSVVLALLLCLGSLTPAFAAKNNVQADPETSCQGLFNQIHKKATKKVPGSTFMLLTLRQAGHLRPLNSSSQRYAYSGNWSI